MPAYWGNLTEYGSGVHKGQATLDNLLDCICNGMTTRNTYVTNTPPMAYEVACSMLSAIVCTECLGVGQNDATLKPCQKCAGRGKIFLRRMNNAEHVTSKSA